MRCIEAIKYAGFNIATLANNHIMDFGAQGLMDTVNLCSQYNIDTVGVGKNLEDASKILYKRKDGETLAIINCCEHEFSMILQGQILLIRYSSTIKSRRQNRVRIMYW